MEANLGHTYLQRRLDQHRERFTLSRSQVGDGFLLQTLKELPDSFRRKGVILLATTQKSRQIHLRKYVKRDLLLLVHFGNVKQQRILGPMCAVVLLEPRTVSIKGQCIAHGSTYCLDLLVLLQIPFDREVFPFMHTAS